MFLKFELDRVTLEQNSKPALFMLIGITTL